jgi:methionyl-tRNA formyltransferase
MIGENEGGLFMPRLVFQGALKSHKILFLGYNENETRLLKQLALNKCEVWHSDKPLGSFADFDQVISFGYRHIISSQLLATAKQPIINLHISLLPWNRGAHPNFWSFYDGTPSGVTIHVIDSGIDTGPILFKHAVSFSQRDKTFADTYKTLIQEIEALFIANIEAILSGTYKLNPQEPGGSFHRKSELPKEFAGWDVEIETEIARLKGVLS